MRIGVTFDKDGSTPETNNKLSDPSAGFPGLLYEPIPKPR